jgi:hypothetical protein
MLSQNSLTLIPFLAAFSIFFAGCGGGSTSSVAPDFTLSVSPSNLSVVEGTTSMPVTISYTPQNGFSGTVFVAISGLPPGAFPSLPGSFALGSSKSQQITFFIPIMPELAPIPVQFQALSNGLNHTADLTIQVTQGPDTAALEENSSGGAPAGTIEIQGLSAGNFTPAYWQNNTLNWVPDVRLPMFAAQTTGPNQSIIAPWPLEQPDGWRLFFGGWDGTQFEFDQIYSAPTSDFLTFGPHELVISSGGFVAVDNENVQQLPDGSLHMICTAALPDKPVNMPVYFSSPDGQIWNGSPEPYSPTMNDIIDLQGYANLDSADFNGANVLFRDNDTWVLYFQDANHTGTIYRATADTLPNFQLQGVALTPSHAVNDVKKFVVNGENWYVMALHFNTQMVWYSLSSDGLTFQPEQLLFNHLGTEDFVMDSIAFVTKGEQILGVLYSGDPGTPDGNVLSVDAIFARWLQKKIILIDSSGTILPPRGATAPTASGSWFLPQASMELLWSSLKMAALISEVAQSTLKPASPTSFLYHDAHSGGASHLHNFRRSPGLSLSRRAFFHKIGSGDSGPSGPFASTSSRITGDNAIYQLYPY